MGREVSLMFQKFDRKVTRYVNDHPARTVIGCVLFFVTCEKIVPRVADPISHAIGRIWLVLL
jgi:hypothetical protein